jgi:hypothetical protein
VKRTARTIFLRLRRDRGRPEGVCKSRRDQNRHRLFSAAAPLGSQPARREPIETPCPRVFLTGFLLKGRGRRKSPHALRLSKLACTSTGLSADSQSRTDCKHRPAPPRPALLSRRGEVCAVMPSKTTRNPQLARYRYQYQPTPTTHTQWPVATQHPMAMARLITKKGGRGAARETQLRVACNKFVI